MHCNARYESIHFWKSFSYFSESYRGEVMGRSGVMVCGAVSVMTVLCLTFGRYCSGFMIRHWL
jgi:hypothetical protein